MDDLSSARDPGHDQCADAQGRSPVGVRPMTGIWAGLTPEQRAAALAYDGPDIIGLTDEDLAASRARVRNGNADAKAMAEAKGYALDCRIAAAMAPKENRDV